MAHFRNRSTTGYTILGLAIIIASIALGVYVGGWVFFIGGIVQVVEAFKATPIEALDVAFGLLKVVLAATVGSLVAVLGTWFGASLMQ